jgi:hypothetical protein
VATSGSGYRVAVQLDGLTVIAGTPFGDERKALPTCENLRADYAMSV